MHFAVVGAQTAQTIVKLVSWHRDHIGQHTHRRHTVDTRQDITIDGLEFHLG